MLSLVLPEAERSPLRHALSSTGRDTYTNVYLPYFF